MSIASARYVRCDECGNPAAIVVEDAKTARLIAKGEGFVRVGGRDLCPNCNPKDPRR